MTAARKNVAPRIDPARAVRPSADRTPPQDLDAEAAVLSAVLTELATFDEHLVGVLRAEHFYSDPNRRIFEAIDSLVSDGQVPNIVAVASRLRDRQQLQQVGGTPYLAQLADAVPAQARIAEQVERVVDRWRLRRMIGEAQSIVAEGFTAAEPTQRLLERFSAQLTDLAYETGSQRGLKPLDPGEAYSQLTAGGEDRAGLSSGLQRYDNQIGGFCPGDLHLIAGRPGMGKTQLLLNIAQSVGQRRGNAVAIFSLEMSQASLEQRLLAMNSGVDLSRLRRGHIRNDEYPRLAEAATVMGRLGIWVDDEPALTPRDMQARCTRLVRQFQRGGDEHRLSLVIIDYLQIMKATDGASREQEIASITRGLKTMAKLLEVPVIALGQLNRDVEKRPRKERRPVLSDLRESGAIEQDSDVVTFLYREDYYDHDAEEAGVLEMIVAKQRNGPLGTVKVAMEKSTGKIRDLEVMRDEDFSEFDVPDEW